MAATAAGHDECSLSSRHQRCSAPALSLLCDRAMRHRLGTLLLVIGIGVLAWTATVYLWKDPFTTAYTAYEQRRLASNLDRQFESWKPSPEPVVAARQAEAEAKAPHDDVSRDAKRFRLSSDDGDAIARLRVPRLGLSLVVIERDGRRRPAARARPAPRDVHARRGRARLRRRAPNDVRRAVLGHRSTRGRRHDLGRAPVRLGRVPRDAPSHRRRQRSLGSRVARSRGARPPGLSSAILREPALPRVRTAPSR